MSEGDDRLTEWKHAYRVLGVPLDASAHSIKMFYRRLVKRWHPDLYTVGTAAHTEATQMTKLINNAYSAIAHAPLRYYIDASTQRAKTQIQSKTNSSASEPIKVKPEEYPNADKIEFWVRFVFGALFGALLAGFVSLRLIFALMPDSLPHPVLLTVGILGVTLGFAFGSARYGDDFWYSIFRRWWLWP